MNRKVVWIILAVLVVGFLTVLGTRKYEAHQYDKAVDKCHTLLEAKKGVMHEPEGPCKKLTSDDFEVVRIAVAMDQSGLFSD